jgi:hypothetical protein
MKEEHGGRRMDRGEEGIEGGKPWIWAARVRSHYEYAYN